MACKGTLTADIGGTEAVFTLMEDGSARLGGTGERAVPSGTETFVLPDHIELDGVVRPVRSVGGRAFCDCRSLRSAVLPDSVVSVGDHAFYGCCSLEEVIMPSVRELRDGVFCGCCSLEEVRVPPSVSDIHPGAFDGCASLRSIHVDDQNACYSDRDGVLFSKDGSVLVRYPVGRPDAEYRVPEGTLKVGGGSFTGTLYLSRVGIPSSVEELDPHALYSCVSIGGIDADAGNRVYASRDGVLFSRDMTRLIRCPPQLPAKDYRVPDEVRTVGRWAFGGCTGLRSAEMPEGVREVLDFAFAGCSMLKEVRIPESVLYVGWGAYIGCDSVRTVDVAGCFTEFREDVFDHGFVDASGDPVAAIGGCRYSLDPVRLQYVEDPVSGEHGTALTDRMTQ